MTKLNLIDTHAHLDMDAFDKDRDQIIARAAAAGVGTIINPAVDLKSSVKIIELAQEHQDVLAAVGFHPSEVAGVIESDMHRLKELAQQPHVVAIGETGLDYYHNRNSREQQMEVLGWELELAAELNLPIILHCRLADDDMIFMLRRFILQQQAEGNTLRGVVHCFSGDAAAAASYLEMGLYLALGGYITYPSSKKSHDVIKQIPDDRLLLETDCPFLAPQAHRGKRNEPAYIVQAAECIAEIKGISLRQVAQLTTANASELFGLAAV